MSFLNQRRLARLAVQLAAVFALGLAAAAPASAGPATEPHPVTARLVPELAAIAPGATLWVDLHLDIASGWHTYWRNPGDSGLPTEIAWTLPAGFHAGDIVWPVPERFVVEGLGNYGYRDTVDLLIPITVGQDVKRARQHASRPRPHGLSAPIFASRARPSWRLLSRSPPTRPHPTRPLPSCSPRPAATCRNRRRSRPALG
jgi:hypothetical protein